MTYTTKYIKFVISLHNYITHSRLCKTLMKGKKEAITAYNRLADAKIKETIYLLNI